MDSGWAVVIGAVVTFAGTIIGPFLLDRRKRRAEADELRRTELAELIPELFRLYEQPLLVIAIPDETRALARLNLLLDKDDWPIASLMALIGTPPYRAPKYQGAALDMIAAWFRGAISSHEAFDRFQRRMGLTVTGKPFDEPEASAT
jgi:hypothetical protein